MGRLGCGDAVFAQHRKLRDQPHLPPEIDDFIFCREDMLSMR